MEEKSLKINQETMDVLVANVIPTTKYFESQFTHMQYQINEIKDNQNKSEVQIDKRFEQVNKRFEQVDDDMKELKLEVRGLSSKIDELSKTMEVTIRDHIIDRDRYYDNKFNNLRMFNIAIVIGIGGIFLKLSNIRLLAKPINRLHKL